MKKGRMQCKDIPDLPILKFINLINNMGSTACPFGPGFYNSVHIAMPEETWYKPKLIHAKMQTLINKGLVSGCTCGCRGMFRLTDKGASILQLHT